MDKSIRQYPPPGSPVAAAVIAGSMMLVPIPVLRGGLVALFPAIVWRSWRLAGAAIVGAFADLLSCILVQEMLFEGWNTRAIYSRVLITHSAPMRQFYPIPYFAKWPNELLYAVDFMGFVCITASLWYWLWPIGRSIRGFLITLVCSSLTAAAAIGILWPISLWLDTRAAQFSRLDPQLLFVTMLAVVMAVYVSIGWTIARVNQPRDAAT